MSHRSRTAPVESTPRQGRRVLGAWALALLAAVWAGAPGAVRADEIILQSGETIEGTIIDATRNTVAVRRAIGGMRQMRIRDIEQVRIELVQGGRVSGQILSWVDGIHHVRSGSEVVSIRDGRVLSRAPYEEPVGLHAGPADGAAEDPAGSEDERAATDPPAPDRSAVESPPAESAAVETPPEEAAAAETSVAETSVVETPAAAPATEEAAAPDSPAEESPSAEPPEAEGPAVAVIPPAESPAATGADSGAGAVAVQASVDLAGSGGDDVVFRIELSRPAEKTVVLIYGTVDGTAKAGADYEPRQGVLTLAPGTRSADVRVPLIQERPAKGDSRFELFLTADPKVATIVDQRVTATIPGDS